MYELLSFSQRHELHKDIATVIELRHAKALDPLCAQLGATLGVCGSAGFGHRLLGARSGASSAQRGQPGRQIRRPTQGYVIEPRRRGARASGPFGDVGKSTLGHANHELRDFDQASLHYQNAMQALGHRLPTTRTQLAKALWLTRSPGDASLGLPTTTERGGAGASSNLLTSTNACPKDTSSATISPLVHERHARVAQLGRAKRRYRRSDHAAYMACARPRHRRHG